MSERNGAGLRAPRRSGRVAVLLGLTMLCLSASQALRTGAASASPTPATFGKTSVGGSSDWFAADRKRVNKYALPVAGAVSELSAYLTPTSNSGQQLLKGIVYADSSGTPGRLLGTSTQLTFTSTSAAGWYHLTFPAPLQLAAGEYWIGVITGASAGVAGYRYDSVTGARDYNANTYTSGPTDPFGSFTKDNQQMSLSATYTATAPPSPPVNGGVPTISGTAQEAMTLTASPGSWSNSPTSYAYEWQRCDAQGENCVAISGAASPTYTLGSGDLGTTLRVSVIASNAAGPSTPATSAQTALVTAPQPPVNSSVPTILGTAQEAMTLTANPGSWSGSPTSYSYQWQRCNSQGATCAPIQLATSSGYTVVAADVNSTLRVSVIAYNAAGPSAPATSAPTAVVTSSAGVQHFGKTSVGGSSDTFGYERKRVNRYALPTAGSVTKLSLYLAPTGTSGQQVLKGLVYADAGGAPGALLGVSEQLTFQSTNSAGWYELVFSSPLKLAAGNVWIGVITGATSNVAGFRYDSVTGARDYNANTYTSGPTDPFGSFTKDNQQMSLSATYTATAPPSPPVNSGVPTISGTAQEAMTLTASPGSWSNSPTSYAYEWQRCDSLGASCTPIQLATSSSYTVVAADLNSTLRVSVIASSAAGPSTPATSAPTAVVTVSSGVQHLEYVFNDSLVSVYDIDQGHKLVQTIGLPQTSSGVRGATVSPGTHMLFVSYGGDGGGNGTGSVLAYDLVAEKVLWSVHLNTGIDSGQVSPDGSRLYMPTGENTSSGIWNVLDTSNGAVVGTIQGGAGAHNTVVSNNGRYVYLGGRNYNNLGVYDTTTGQVRYIGPLVNGVRPFTVNGSNTLAFTTATDFDGFQVSSITTGKVLFTVSFGNVPPAFRFSAPSHGTSLSPDEKQLYVIDAVNKEVQAYDVSRVSEGVAPTQLGVVPVAGLSGTESGCAYDCGRGGWLQRSIDGRFVYVGDSGEVIDTATRTVLTTLTTLLNTKKSLEIDWANGVPVSTSGRTGVGQVG